MADIRAITAPIGGGKSLFGVIQVCEELERSERFVVTDIPLILENAPDGYWTMADYCHKFIKRPVDLNKRLCVLNYDQAREFWRFLPAAFFEDLEGLEVVENNWQYGSCRMVKLPNIKNEIFKEVTDFSFRTKKAVNRVGCHYIIDEAHKKFPPMFYQRCGAQAEWYMSELRKLDDDFDWITQHPEKVDKNFRRDATEWLQVQNMGKTSMFMGVSLPNRFRWHWYNQSDMPTRSDKPTASGWYYIEPKKRYHHLYRTMDGTGVSGGLVKESQRHRGRHPIIWVIAIAAVLLGAYFLPRVVQQIVRGSVHSVLGGIQKGASDAFKGSVPAMPKNNAFQQPQQTFSVQHRPSMVNAAPSPASAIPSAPSVEGLYCTGVMYAPFQTNAWVMLSDGRVADGHLGQVQGIGTAYVKVFGLPPIPIREYH
jgi:hypothetical protein